MVKGRGRAVQAFICTSQWRGGRSDSRVWGSALCASRLSIGIVVYVCIRGSLRLHPPSTQHSPQVKHNFGNWQLSDVRRSQFNAAQCARTEGGNGGTEGRKANAGGKAKNDVVAGCTTKNGPIKSYKKNTCLGEACIAQLQSVLRGC